MGQREILSLNTSMRGKSSSLRRLDEDSVLTKEDEPDKGGALSPKRYFPGCGSKRKLSEYEEPVLDLSYPQQRQLVLDLCRDKLQSCQRDVEPSLYRSVLLANTLRQIQQEMSLEGGDALPRASPSTFPVPTPRHVTELPSIFVDISVPVLFEPMPSSSSLSSPSSSPMHGDVKPSLPSPIDKAPDFLSEITNSTGYLSDLPLDDIFEDIDTSMYDSSEISVLAFSAPNEDRLKNLQLCLADLNDLDYIMDILVRS